MMTTQHSNDVPVKGSYIKNPNTQRMVLVGSRTWLKLIADGKISGDYKDPSELCDKPQDEKEVKKKIKELNKSLPRGIHAVRGRGKYANKIVKRKKMFDIQDVGEKVKSVATKITKKLVSDEPTFHLELEDEIEKMIMADLLEGKPRLHKEEEEYDDFKESDFEDSGDEYY